MSLTLEKLSPLLSQQYCELPWDNHISTKNFQFEIDNVSITVSVAMKRIKHRVPKAEIVFRGKALTDTATVEITPPNIQVWQAVVNHFKSQVEPRANDQNEAIFDFVKINGLLV
jgi:hypothetical protein